MCPYHKHPAKCPNCGQGPSHQHHLQIGPQMRTVTQQSKKREREQGPKERMKKIGGGREKEKTKCHTMHIKCP